MNFFHLLTYKPEQRLSPRILQGVIVLIDLIFLYVAQGILKLTPSIDHAMTIYLVVFGVVVVSFLVDLGNTYLGSWFTFLGCALVVFAICTEYDAPEVLPLLALPIGLMASMTDLPSAGLATVTSTLALLAFQRFYYPAITPMGMAIAIVGCWGMLAVLVAIYVPINQLAQWMNQHFELSERLLNEARDRKAEMEGALDGLANANRQLALANKKMAVLSKIAEDAQKAKSTFVANVSHEFRTPLNMIIGLIDLMIRNPENYDVVLSPKMREDFTVIYRNCEHLSNMVTDVLDLTRVETGRLVLYREWVDLRDIIEKGFTVVKPLMEKKGLVMQAEIAEGLPPVYCDRVRIQQVILNLLSNAARFTEKGGISLIVTQDGQQVTLQVRDSGSGIPQEDRERIFEPFWQGRDPIWQKKGGSGIGLSLSREFVRMHGGHMWFESEVRQGSSFFFNLPISPLIDPTARPGSQIKDDWVWKEKSFLSGQVGTTSEIVKPRVIIFDETDTLYSRFVHYTDKVEFVNIQSLDQFGREGMSKAFILNAPTVDKLWPMVQTAVNSATPTTVIGCSVPGEYRRALETGATGYLIKPIKMEDLKRILDSFAQPVHEIMILDDDTDVLSLYKRMLLAFDASLKVRTISSGREALAEIQAQPPDLMLLDIVMPEMNGWQVLEEIGRMGFAQPFPIYFITAQDPIDNLVSGYVLATIKGGVPLSKLLNVSMEISSLLMESEREPDPEPEPDLEDELV